MCCADNRGHRWTRVHTCADLHPEGLRGRAHCKRKTSSALDVVVDIVWEVEHDNVGVADRFQMEPAVARNKLVKEPIVQFGKHLAHILRTALRAPARESDNVREDHRHRLERQRGHRVAARNLGLHRRRQILDNLRHLCCVALEPLAVELRGAAENLVDGPCHFLDRGPLKRVCGPAAPDQLRIWLAERAVLVAEWWALVACDCIADLGLCAALPGCGCAHVLQLPQYNADAVDVACLGVHLARNDLGRCPGQRPFCGHLCADRGEPEISQLGREARVDENVRGLEIHVEHGRVLLVQERQAAARIKHDANAHRWTQLEHFVAECLIQ
eukprot:comp22538_c0_seq1/m.56955 comp22538_c0_seq1/g.56955  ORF comp22538_c0_seq1/g.56955 comp22538_c0_seq1/m.56955 type:complete len:328 (+) comp22538_c0_seq1:609-1592(+)